MNPRLKILPFLDGEKIIPFLQTNKPASERAISSSQELVHWAGTVCVGRGELEITFEELLDAMHASRQ